MSKPQVSTATNLMYIVHNISNRYPNKDVDAICEELIDLIIIPENELDIFWDRLMQETYVDEGSLNRYFFE